MNDDQSPQSPANGTSGIPPSSDENSVAGQTSIENEDRNAQAGSDDQTAQHSSDDQLPQSPANGTDGIPPSFHDSAVAGQQFQSSQTELEQAQQKAEEYLNGWKRSQADYQNLKRDMEKEKVELAKFANLSLFLELLPVLDNFGRAIRHLPEEKKRDEWVKGVLAIHQQFRSLVSSMGVTEVPVDGMFNPELHEAVGNGDGENVPTGTILEVVQPGYMLYGKLMRPAKVKVAK